MLGQLEEEGKIENKEDPLEVSPNKNIDGRNEDMSSLEDVPLNERLYEYVAS